MIAPARSVQVKLLSYEYHRQNRALLSLPPEPTRFRSNIQFISDTFSANALRYTVMEENLELLDVAHLNCPNHSHENFETMFTSDDSEYVNDLMNTNSTFCKEVSQSI